VGQENLSISLAFHSGLQQIGRTRTPRLDRKMRLLPNSWSLGCADAGVPPGDGLGADGRLVDGHLRGRSAPRKASGASISWIIGLESQRISALVIHSTEGRLPWDHRFQAWTHSSKPVTCGKISTTSSLARSSGRSRPECQTATSFARRSVPISRWRSRTQRTTSVLSRPMSRSLHDAGSRRPGESPKDPLAAWRCRMRPAPLMRALVKAEYREPFLEIRQVAPEHKLVTGIEVLSLPRTNGPTPKVGGYTSASGWRI
jgi:hypothetical protein